MNEYILFVLCLRNMTNKNSNKSQARHGINHYPVNILLRQLFVWQKYGAKANLFLYFCISFVPKMK